VSSIVNPSGVAASGVVADLCGYLSSGTYSVSNSGVFEWNPLSWSDRRPLNLAAELFNIDGSFATSNQIVLITQSGIYSPIGYIQDMPSLCGSGASCQMRLNEDMVFKIHFENYDTYNCDSVGDGQYLNVYTYVPTESFLYEVEYNDNYAFYRSDDIVIPTIDSAAGKRITYPDLSQWVINNWNNNPQRLRNCSNICESVDYNAVDWLTVQNKTLYWWLELYTDPLARPLNDTYGANYTDYSWIQANKDITISYMLFLRESEDFCVYAERGIISYCPTTQIPTQYFLSYHGDSMYGTCLPPASGTIIYSQTVFTGGVDSASDVNTMYRYWCNDNVYNYGYEGALSQLRGTYDVSAPLPPPRSCINLTYNNNTQIAVSKCAVPSHYMKPCGIFIRRES